MLGQVPVQRLIISRRSLFGAMTNWSAGRRSRTDGPISIWITEDDKYLLVDGYHRVFEALIKGESILDVEVVGDGYTNYWVTPRPDDYFTYQATKYSGLEDLAEVDILDELAQRLQPKLVDEEMLVKVVSAFGFIRHPDKPGFWIEPYSQITVRHRTLRRWASESDLRQRILDEVGHLLGKKTW